MMFLDGSFLEIEKLMEVTNLKRSRSVLLLSILATSLFVSLGFAQSASAKKPSWEPFYFTVNMETGEHESNLDWLSGWNVYPLYWWHNKHRPPFPSEEYWEGEYFVCHGDWCTGCVLYDGTGRYQWWIYWDDSPYVNPEAQCVGGHFTFSSGSRDFGGIRAYGSAWVDWAVVDDVISLTYQHHEGMIWHGPE